jgi:mannose-6-phosphate isomerase
MLMYFLTGTDANHKPEMAVALTAFSGFCGFRPPSQIAAFLTTVPEFASLLGPKVTASFSSRFQTQEITIESTKEGLKEMFSALMNADADKVKLQVGQLIQRLSNGDTTLEKEERELVMTLNEDFPGDVGIFCTFVLNVVHLMPGEAVFLKANEPHAYLDGGTFLCHPSSIPCPDF